MPQDNMKPNDRSNFPRFNRPKGDDDANPKKGPKFNIYWIWGIIALILIGVEFYGPLSQDVKQTDELEFRKNMLAKGDVEKIETITNKGIVRVYIKKDSLQKPFYEKFNKNGVLNGTGPQFEFKVT
ncbi:MAG TPA: AAA family ATPase, partial [Puia sp.]|nr:AAA family ATPase [Puia sp.]